MTKLIAIIRIRGSMETAATVEDTLRFLRLGRKNHCVLIPDSPVLRGMLQKAKDFATWGEVDSNTVGMLLQKRAEILRGQRLTDEYLEKNTPFKSVSEFAHALMEGKVTFSDVKSLKPMFRLSPPRKGFKHSIKRPYPKGELGYRKEKINELLARMI